MSDRTGPVLADVTHLDGVPATLEGLGLHPGRPVLVCVGGAAGMTAAQVDAVSTLLGRLAPSLDRWGAAVVDGGTDSGVMRAVGRARHSVGARFPLVGVVARGTVPGAHGLEPHHTHVLRVPGGAWGDESPWLSQVATVLAGGRPALTVVANGGDVTLVDVEHSVAAGRPVLVLSGTGRAADALAAAAAPPGRREAEEGVVRLRASPLVRAVAVNDATGFVSAVGAALDPAGTCR